MRTPRRHTRHLLRRGAGCRWLVAFVALASAVAGPASAQTWQQDAWSDTVYYRASFRADQATEALLHVAAADRYVAYLNGTEVGADSSATRMTAWPVSVRRFANELAVRVVNEGRGSGSGLRVLLVGDSLRIETSTNPAVQAWYWTAQAQTGTAWTTAKTQKGAWQTVQSGSLDAARIEDLADTTTTVAAVAGLPGGVDAGAHAGGLTLGRIDGVNLALGRPTNRAAVTDGDLGTSWDPPVNAMNYFASVDLQARRRIHQVRVLTRGLSDSQLEENSLRGYSVQISDDNITFSEVGQLRGIERYDWTAVTFDPVVTRHVRVVINELDPATSPKVAEVQVLGTGTRDEGWYVSPPVQPAGDRGGNLGRVEWDASLPAGTGVTVQVRGGDSPADLADADLGWSDPVAARGDWYPAAEPAAWFQYRVHLTSPAGDAAPVFAALRLGVDTLTAASRARAWVTPTQVPMGVDTTFTCSLVVEQGADDAGIERLTLEVPAPAALDEQAPVAALLRDWSSTAERLTLVFAEPLRSLQELAIPLRTRTYATVHTFRPALYAPGSDNPLNAAERTDVDAATGAARSWTVRATTAPSRTLTRVRARPPVVTPNGDAVNDATVIGFVLAKLDVPRRIEIDIHDLSGHRVRRLPRVDLAAGQYTAADGPGAWDGRDDGGALVPPGLYLFRVRADLDTGEEIATGVVAVAY